MSCFVVAHLQLLHYVLEDGSPLAFDDPPNDIHKIVLIFAIVHGVNVVTLTVVHAFFTCRCACRMCDCYSHVHTSIHTSTL